MVYSFQLSFVIIITKTYGKFTFKFVDGQYFSGIFYDLQAINKIRLHPSDIYDSLVHCSNKTSIKFQ